MVYTIGRTTIQLRTQYDEYGINIHPHSLYTFENQPELLKRLSVLSGFDEHGIILMNSFHLRRSALHLRHQEVVILIFSIRQRNISQRKIYMRW